MTFEFEPTKTTYKRLYEEFEDEDYNSETEPDNEEDGVDAGTRAILEELVLHSTLLKKLLRVNDEVSEVINNIENDLTEGGVTNNTKSSTVNNVTDDNADFITSIGVASIAGYAALFYSAYQDYEDMNPDNQQMIQDVVGTLVDKVFNPKWYYESIKNGIETNKLLNTLIGQNSYNTSVGGIKESSPVTQGINNGLDYVSNMYNNVKGGIKSFMSNGDVIGGTTENIANNDSLLSKIGALDGGSRGYDSVNSNRTPEGRKISEMTVSEVMDYQRYLIANPKGKSSSAIGKYQIMYENMKTLVQNGTIKSTDVFNKSTQDKAGYYLMMNKDPLRTKVMKEYINNREGYKNGTVTKEVYERSRTNAAEQLSHEWAILPSVSQGGKSYYWKDGNNKAGITLNEFYNMLDTAELPDLTNSNKVHNMINKSSSSVVNENGDISKYSPINKTNKSVLSTIVDNGNKNYSPVLSNEYAAYNETIDNMSGEIDRSTKTEKTKEIERIINASKSGDNNINKQTINTNNNYSSSVNKPSPIQRLFDNYLGNTL